MAATPPSGQTKASAANQPGPSSAGSSRAQDYVNSYKPQDVPTPPRVVRGPFVHTEDDSVQSGAAPIPSNPPEGGPTRRDAPELPQQTANVAELDINIDIEDAERWQRERVERKMRGEYERAGRALSQLVYENLDMPLHLHAIRVQGAKVTRPGFLSSVVAPFLTQESPGRTLRDVLSTTREVNAVLSSFGIFSEVDAAIEPSRSVLSGPEDVDVVMRVREASRYFLKTSTDVGNGEGSASATARIRNAFGGAELVEGNMSFGTKTKNAFQLRFETPVNASSTTRFDLTAFSTHRDLAWFASCQERSKGLIARLRGIYGSSAYEVAYEAALREIGQVSPAASMSVRDSAGPSTKSSVSATLTHDTRDDPFLATRGTFSRLRTEYAGLGGDSRFWKAETENSISRELGSGLVGSLSLRSGLMSSTDESKRTLFVDRFQLGGPTSVRMFRQNSMGRKDNADHIGGDAYWAAGASLFSPIPRKEHWPVKAHLFLNAGRLIGFRDGVQSTLDALVRQPNVTAGVGLMYKHSIVRIEGNIGVPLAAHKHEGAMKGLQFGLGLSFL